MVFAVLHKVFLIMFTSSTFHYSLKKISPLCFPNITSHVQRGAKAHASLPRTHLHSRSQNCSIDGDKVVVSNLIKVSLLEIFFSFFPPFFLIYQYH